MRTTTSMILGMALVTAIAASACDESRPRRSSGRGGDGGEDSSSASGDGGFGGFGVGGAGGFGVGGAGGAASSSSSSGNPSGSSSSSSGSSSASSSSSSSGNPNCPVLNVGGFGPSATYDNTIEGSPTVNIDGADPDAIQVEFYGAAPAQGNHNLAAGLDANYGTCENCVLLYTDLDTAAGTVAKFFFQQSGTMNITLASATPNLSKGTLTNVKLIEVTIDPNTFTSTPVPGGDCYTIQSASF